MDKILKNVPLGSKISVIDVFQYQPWKHKGDYNEDVLYIVYKDDNGNKDVMVIPKPEQEIFFTKPEYRYMWNLTRDSAPRDLLFPKMVRPHRILSAIHNELKDEDTSYSNYYKDIARIAYETSNNRAKKELHKYPHVFMSDIGITDSYRINLSLQYDTTGPHILNKSYMDIETDIFGLSEKETKVYNMDRINAITYITAYNPQNKNDDTNHVFTFLLRDHDTYPQQVEFEKNLAEFDRICHEEFDEIDVVVNGQKVRHKSKLKFHIFFFDTEADLLHNFYQIVNATNPDVMDIWNIAFDIPKIVKRAEKCGLNPVQLMSHPKFPKEARYLDINIDNRGKIDFANKKTFIKSSNTFLYIDQMLLYAGMNKGSKAIQSYSLDTVVEKELGLHKRKFKKGVTIKNAAREQYKEFVLYSINDTFLQAVLDKYTAHNNTLFIDTQTAAVSPEYTTKPTTYTRNYYHFEKIKRFNMIPGNNPNADYLGDMDAEKYELLEEYREAVSNYKNEAEENGEDIEFDDELEKEMYEKVYSKYEDSPTMKHPLSGGLVGDPNLNIANGVELIDGYPSKHVYHLAIDLDYASEYPWIKYTRNLGKETEIGRYIISGKISDEQDPYNNDHYLPGAEFISDYISRDWVSMGRVYFNLPTSTDLIQKYMRRM